MNAPRIAIALVVVAALGAGNGCSKSSVNNTAKDAAADAGAGGSIPDGRQDLPVGADGTSDAGLDIATVPVSDGAAGAGGAGGSSGGAGGVSGSGGGGAAGAGGKNGTGGATGKGGSSGVDGGAVKPLCGYECRTDAAGVTGWYSGSTLICAASCLGHKAICDLGGSKSEGCYADSYTAGCDGRTSLIKYTTCAPIPNALAYLAWQAPAGDTGKGPAVVVKADSTGAGLLTRFISTAGFAPETPPYESPATLTQTQIRTLFQRLEAVDMTSLPHEPLATSGCSASLYFRTCEDCAPTTLTYAAPASVTPEMESIWSWFDDVVGETSLTNPRRFCATVGADP